MIASITQQVMSNGREGEPLWFHPRACLLPGGAVFMTGQGISGSDYFHPVHWMVSEDGGRSWSTPEPVPGFGRADRDGGVIEGVCDVVPEYHPLSKTVLAVGHNVYYREGRLMQPQLQRWPVYNVWDLSSRRWSKKRKLEWDNRGASAIYTCGCAQRHTLDDGDILIPMRWAGEERADGRVCTVRVSFDGREVRVLESGSSIELQVKRGLLEPTITSFRDRYYMTIRAEDDRGYVVASKDGMRWSRLTPWCWDDGEPLTMSTTQQRWLTHSEGLFLVYTRKDATNVNVMRWRAPLWVARVDTDQLRLVRDTERIAVPLRGDGVADPDHVARLGNFHTVNVSPHESWVTVGESLPAQGWKGDTIISRITWERPNRLVD